MNDAHEVKVQTITVGEQSYLLLQPLVVRSPITVESLQEALDTHYLLGYALKMADKV